MALKESRRVPWWIFIIAAVFLGDFVLQTYGRIIARPQFSYTARTENGRPVVDLVTPGGPADRAGLKPGDIILSIDGRDIRQYTGEISKIFRLNFELNRPYRFEIEREGHRLGLSIELERARAYRGRGDIVHIAWQFASFILLLTAFLIAFSRPYDIAARSGALAMAMLSVGLYFTNMPPGYAVIWRALPRAVGMLLWIPHVCVYLFGPILLTFFIIFPRPLFRSRWLWAAVWLPGLFFLPLDFRFDFLIVYYPARAYEHIPPGWFYDAQVALLGLYGLAAVAVLTANYFRLKDANERRRLRLLLIGGAAGVLPGLIRLVLVGAFPKWPVTVYIFNEFYPDVFIAVIFLLFPVSFAFSILRHRLLDIRVMVRRGLQYSLARGTLLAMMPVLGALLALDLSLNRQQTVAEIFRRRGWIYAGLGLLALVAYKKRKTWLEKLDKHFFREQYNSQRILASVLEDIREARSFERVAPRVVTRIEAALHPEFVSVMMRRPGDSQYRLLFSAPLNQTTPPLDADSKLIALARVLGKPLEVLKADTAWLEGRLPQQEIELARAARIDLFVPIGSPSGSTEAVLALGIKKSDEPYTREDQELLEAIGTSLGLLFEQWAPAPEAGTKAFKICPTCGLLYDQETNRCQQDGTELIYSGVPRTLAGRYHLERRLGRGGMGNVFEATDSGLERRVAVKVMRDHLAGSTEAAQRFRREARAAAGFSHPNVVTVHDYGVAEDKHAFLVMELLEGCTLRDELLRQKRLKPPRLVEIFRGVCAAVDAAHRRLIIHRDLKPENIFLARSETLDKPGETVKVLDFGIAKILTPPSPAELTQTLTAFETSSGVLVGTFAYVSPEQLLGESPGILWDLWALSVVAYESLSGRLPFETASMEAWRNQLLAGKFKPLEEFPKEATAAWQIFFDDCFSRDRTKRPQSAADFLGRLEKILAQA